MTRIGATSRVHLARVALAAAALLGMFGGCASIVRDDGPHPVWPAPPASPRIVHVRTIRSVADLARPSFFDQLGAAVTGRQAQSLIRPHACAVLDAGRGLAVTDQEAQGVHLLDMARGTSRLITRAGDVHLVSPVGVAGMGERIAVSDSALKRVLIYTRDGEYVTDVRRPEGFERPTGLVYDATHGELYVVDTGAHDVCVFTSDGRWLRRIGEPGVGPGQLNFPTHACLDGSGRLLVTDSLNFRVQGFDRLGRYMFHIGKAGDASGHVAVPKGVGVDSFGHIYVVDSYFSTVQIFDSEGRFLLSFGGPGRAASDFQVPSGLTIDGHNRIYVCDSHNGRVQVFDYVGGPNDDQP